MRKQLLSIILWLVTVHCSSQISFEQGYYITNSGQKVGCLIKNVDWKDNPREFYYQLSAEGEKNKATIEDVKEFGIENTCKFVRHLVKVDRSSDNLSDLSSTSEPVFTEEVLFLKLLVEGKASLINMSMRTW